MQFNVKIGKITLKNPVMPASGTFGFGIEYEGIVPIEKLGALVTKGITLMPKEGNPPPRILEVKNGLLNTIGLENPGIERFLKEMLQKMVKYKVPIIVNISGESFKEYEEIANILDKESISGIEINISCPNVEKGGIEFGKEPSVVFSLVSLIRKRTNKTLITKLTPNVSDIKGIAKAAEDAGSDAISLINTVKAMAFFENRQFFGGLSGPCIKPIALRMVWEAYNTVSIPIIGVGGIQTPEDAIDFFKVGAIAIQIGSANIADPLACIKIIDGIYTFQKF
ncbi:TPA: dihydroorotate dehydrogenase [bacterium]|nr:dihydroorotate dehydrogenase [bacterium]